MHNKNIILGVTGSIAAYKACELVRMLRARGAHLRVVMTKNAQEFITPLTMQTLAGSSIYTEMFNRQPTSDLDHIALARWADAIVIAPTSANFIAKLAHGLADDLLSTVCLATKAPIAIVPAMNHEMWQAAATQGNLASLKQRGVLVFGPAYGQQVCGEVGFGRMLELSQLVALISTLFKQPMVAANKIVITAGPTYEALDPIRYIGNHSSGKMGYALASAAVEAGAQVVLISGPTQLTSPLNAICIQVQTAIEMYQAVMAEVESSDIFIAAAAVADFRPEHVYLQKIKKSNMELTLKLQPTPDIVAAVAALAPRPFTVGFAAETENLLANARRKLANKNLDMIIANYVGDNRGVARDENEVVILRKNAKPQALSLAPKINLARQIIEIIYQAKN